MSGEAPGFFGKLPSRGDFVCRRLAPDFVERWDGWLQEAIAASRSALGDAWLGVYLTSPIWRFALPPGVCGRDGHVGVVIPSVDKVGRYFPLAAAAACAADVSPLALAADLDDWYTAVEDALLSTLAERPLELDALDERLAALRLPPARVSRPASAAAPAHGEEALTYYAVLEEQAPADALLPVAADALAGRGAAGLWWTRGSERIAPCVLLASRLPEPDAFAAMLDGRWADRGWTCGSVRRARAERPLRWAGRSAAVSDIGRTRNANEDAYACRDQLGAWIVADGLGGHQAGELASRMTVSALDAFGAGGAPADPVRRLTAALGVVNGCLRVLAERDANVALAASTVAALLLEGDAAACVWAGDSRVYRLRDGALAQLSRDHSEVQGGVAERHVVTRAVGGDGELAVEVARDDLRDGDRYLLCTDGLYAEVAPETIVDALSLADPERACDRLKEAALAGDARDNLTAVVVHVRRAAAPGAAR